MTNCQSLRPSCQCHQGQRTWTMISRTRTSSQQSIASCRELHANSFHTNDNNEQHLPQPTLKWNKSCQQYTMRTNQTACCHSSKEDPFLHTRYNMPQKAPETHNKYQHIISKNNTSSHGACMPAFCQLLHARKIHTNCMHGNMTPQIHANSIHACHMDSTLSIQMWSDSAKKYRIPAERMKA